MSKEATFTPSQTLYNRDGRKLYFRRDLGDGTAIVSRWLASEGWEGDIEEYVSDEPIIVPLAQLFLSPPTEVLAGEVADLIAKANAAREELSALHFSTTEAKREHDQLVATIKAAEPLRNIEAFIAGKITHFVMLSQSYDAVFYGDVSIATFEQGITYFRDSGRADGMKLLSLFGGSKGDLSWRISQYSDSSGGHRLVLPCLSEDEARLKAAEALEQFWAEPQANDYRIASAIKSADALGFPVPAEVRAKMDAKAIAALTSKVEEARKALEAAEANLSTAAATLSKAQEASDAE